MQAKEVSNSTKVPRKKKRTRLWKAFNSIVLWCNYLFALALGLSYVAPYVSPANFWIMAFLGLAYPFLLIANVFFLVYWLLLWKKKFLISALAIIVGYSQLSTFFQWNVGKAASITSENAIKILSYNVRLFDLYNWSKNKETRDKIFDMLVAEESDILCLQEVYVDDTEDFKTVDSLIDVQKANNIHFQLTAVVKETHKFGIATLTKYPIVNKGVIKFPETKHNVCIYTDIVIKEDTIRIYNAHLESVRLGSEDYQYLEGLLSENKEKVEYQRSKNIIKRFKNAFAKRAIQAEALKEHMNTSPYPYVVCGDFNDTPASYTYHTIRGGMVDAFLNSGFGLGKTYIGKLPSFRIDYILHSTELSSSDFYIVSEELSDHYPITCKIYKK